MTSRQKRIETNLGAHLEPEILIVENESNNHRVPEHAETHFKITLVSIAFHDMSRLERHRKINALLASELTSGLHALSLHLYTPEEWLSRAKAAPKSPPCQHKNPNSQ